MRTCPLPGARASSSASLHGLATLRDQDELFGPVASDPTLWRTLDAIGEPQRRKIARVRARTREHVWSLIEARHGRIPPSRVADRYLGRTIVVLLAVPATARVGAAVAVLGFTAVIVAALRHGSMAILVVVEWATLVGVVLIGIFAFIAGAGQSWARILCTVLIVFPIGVIIFGVVDSGPRGLWGLVFLLPFFALAVLWWLPGTSRGIRAKASVRSRPLVH